MVNHLKMDPAEWLRPCVSTCTPKRTWPWQILSQPGDGSSQFSAGKPMEKPMETHGKTHGNPWKKPWKNGQTNGKTPWNVFPCFLKCWVTHWQRYITQWQKHSWKHVLFWGNKYGIYGRNLMKHGNGCHLQTVAFLKPAKYTTGWWF